MNLKQTFIYVLLFINFNHEVVCFLDGTKNASLPETLCDAKYAGCRFVLSGGPGVGKSSVIQLLQINGHQVVPEVWTLLFEQAKRNNSLEAFSALSNAAALREKQMKMQQEFEGQLDKACPAFLDRSTIDVVAFGHLYNVPMSASLLNVPRRGKYDLIFFLEPLPQGFYKKTELCSQEKSIEIHCYLKKFYRDMGYSIIEVPFDSPENRMKFILKTITGSSK